MGQCEFCGRDCENCQDVRSLRELSTGMGELRKQLAACQQERDIYWAKLEAIADALHDIRIEALKTENLDVIRVVGQLDKALDCSPESLRS